MSQLGKNGHVYCPFNELIEKADEFLGVSTDIVRNAIITLTREKLIVVERDESNSGVNPVYEKILHVCECGIAERLQKLAAGSNGLHSKETDLPKVVAEIEKEMRIKLAPEQREAVRAACESKVMVITGGGRSREDYDYRVNRRDLQQGEV